MTWRTCGLDVGPLVSHQVSRILVPWPLTCLQIQSFFSVSLCFLGQRTDLLHLSCGTTSSCGFPLHIWSLSSSALCPCEVGAGFSLRVDGMFRPMSTASRPCTVRPHLELCGSSFPMLTIVQALLPSLQPLMLRASASARTVLFLLSLRKCLLTLKT